MCRTSAASPQREPASVHSDSRPLLPRAPHVRCLALPMEILVMPSHARVSTGARIFTSSMDFLRSTSSLDQILRTATAPLSGLAASASSLEYSSPICGSNPKPDRSFYGFTMLRVFVLPRQQILGLHHECFLHAEMCCGRWFGTHPILRLEERSWVDTS